MREIKTIVLWLLVCAAFISAQSHYFWIRQLENNISILQEQNMNLEKVTGDIDREIIRARGQK